ncbi:EGFR adapter protein-like, partial [Saccoglossus kowalevskii]|uniref:Tensin-4-like n=1 Tax=Saccoglossus kowalevskii TaxID=10224 RepID=A0ABM0MPI4_SACKO
SSSSRSVENNAATEFSHLDIHDRRITHEENLLKNVPWFQSGIPREIAMEILQQDEIGAFVVRNSGSHPGCYALSMKVTKDVNRIGIVNYLIEYKNGKYTLKGSGKVFPDLTTLINYYSMNRDLLPCRLNLARTNPIYHVVDPDVKDDLRCDEDESDEEDDQDYLKLSDFTTLMNEIRPH